MSLRQIAKADNKNILNDDVCGFGWPVKLTPPNSETLELKGFTDDIAQIIDPDTGTPVSGRLISVVFHIQDLIDAGINIFLGDVRFNNPKSKPWIVEFDDINGVSLTFKIRSADPDRTIGQIVCILEVYDIESMY